MDKTIKILKINVLSLVAIPLLLLATAFKLISKALEKIAIFVALIFLAIISSVIVAKIVASPNSILNAIAVIIVAMLCFGLAILIVYWLFSLVSGFVSVIWQLLLSLLDNLYELTYAGYLSLFTSCESDYVILSLNGKKVPNALLCLFFTILRGLSWIIVGIVSISYYLAIGISIIVAAIPIIDVWHSTKSAFGMSLFEYWGKCSAGSVIGGIFLYVVFVGIVVTALMALANEWYEWALELKMSDKQISEDINSITQTSLQLAAGSSEEMEKNMAIFKKLEDHIQTLEELGGRVQKALDQKDNPVLRSQWGVYMRNLSPIVEECSNKKGISMEMLRKISPQIDLLDKQRKDVSNMLDKYEKELQNPAGSTTFFVGCTTPEKLEKRYKSLCKTYHPDVMEGDATTFQKMQAESEMLKGSMQENK